MMNVSAMALFTNGRTRDLTADIRRAGTTNWTSTSSLIRFVINFSGVFQDEGQLFRQSLGRRLLQELFVRIRFCSKSGTVCGSRYRSTRQWYARQEWGQQRQHHIESRWERRDGHDEYRGWSVDVWPRRWKAVLVPEVDHWRPSFGANLVVVTKEFSTTLCGV